MFSSTHILKLSIKSIIMPQPNQLVDERKFSFPEFGVDVKWSQ